MEQEEAEGGGPEEKIGREEGERSRERAKEVKGLTHIPDGGT